MTVVKLTRYENQRPIWLNVEHIVYVTPEALGTRIYFLGGSVLVNETPEEILSA